MKKILFSVLLSAGMGTSLFSQATYTFDYSSEHISGDTYELKFIFDIADEYHVYGQVLEGDGPGPMIFSFSENDRIEFLGGIEPLQDPEIKVEEVFPATVELYSGRAEFIRKVRVPANETVTVSGNVEFQTCHDTRGCMFEFETFDFVLGKDRLPTAAASLQSIGTKNTVETSAITDGSVPAFQNISRVESPDSPGDDNLSADDPADTAAVTDSAGTQTIPAIEESGEEDLAKVSLLRLLLLGIIGGFTALILPCVYPIIPLTVSFFGRDASRSRAVSNGILYGVSIIFIYTFFGLIAGLTQFDLADFISTSWVANLIFFLLFIALALSFFGLYEITLPSSWSTKIDRQADKGGFLGPFFMALATVVISFSCTGLFVGGIIGLAMQGDVVRPVVGMFGFGLAFALPFTLLAIFPGVMNKLPKSGGWLNEVKVFFAFVLLASSIIFLSKLNMDFFKREMAVAILIAILVMLGVYLLGKIRFSHDTKVEHASIPRIFISVLIFAFALRLVPGLIGYPLANIDEFLPVKKAYKYGTDVKGNMCTDNPLYADIFEDESAFPGYYDYEEAMQCAKKLNKPVFVYFTGHRCSNCKSMNSTVFSPDKNLREKIISEFVIVSLYLDDKTKIGNTTLGAKYKELQLNKFGYRAVPYFVLLDPDGHVLTKKNMAFTKSEDTFEEFLNEGLKNFKARQ